MHVADDIYLTDHTVSADDPRLTDAYNSRTRIRRLTGFDSSLMRDRVWAVKTNNDISKGLAEIEKIERQMRQHEQGSNRAYDVEKLNLERRMSRLASRSSRHRASSIDSTAIPASSSVNHHEESRLSREIDKMIRHGNASIEKMGSYMRSLETLLIDDDDEKNNDDKVASGNENANQNDDGDPEEESSNKKVHFAGS